MPRILTDRPLPSALAGDVRWRGAEEEERGQGYREQAGAGTARADDFAAYADFMRSCRINVSIRAVG